MPTITVTADYDGYVSLDNTGAYTKYDAVEPLYVGYATLKEMWSRHRTYARFPLTDLPSGAIVTQVRLLAYCHVVGGAAHLSDVHAYGGAGQEDPGADGAQTCYDRCAGGNLYVDDSTELRTTGQKSFTLPSQANTDVQNAKAAVNRFSLALHEEGDNDPYAALRSLEHSLGSPPQLEITYEIPGPPAGGETQLYFVLAKGGS